MDIQEYNKIAKDIADKYKHRILPRCRIFEQERVYEKNKRTFFISVFIFCVFLVIFSLVSNTSPSLKIISCIPLAIVSYIVNLLSEKNIERKIKKSIMPHLCSCFGDLEWIEEDINSKQSSYKKKRKRKAFY